jgi:hypothetical protein
MSDKPISVPAKDRYFDWSDPLTRFGVCVSFGWLIFSGLGLWAVAKWEEMAPNEWGDLVAGVAAPLAFFWLVLGFLQQGKELRLSSRALMLQVEELKNTVRHQADLVDVTRQQVMVQVRQDDELRRARQLSIQPRFVMITMVRTPDSAGNRYTIKITNLGATITGVRIEFAGGPEFKFHMLTSEEPQQFKVTFAEQTHLISGVIHYTNAEGVKDAVVFAGTINDAKQLSFAIPAEGVFA